MAFFSGVGRCKESFEFIINKGAKLNFKLIATRLGSFCFEFFGAFKKKLWKCLNFLKVECGNFSCCF